MRIRFFNVRVLTMEEKPEETGYPVIEHGQVWVKDGKIEKIVEDGEISKLAFSEEKWDREIDGQGNLMEVIPYPVGFRIIGLENGIIKLNRETHREWGIMRASDLMLVWHPLFMKFIEK